MATTDPSLPLFDTPQIMPVEAVPTAVVRFTEVNITDLTAHYDAVFSSLIPTLSKRGIAFAGPPIALYPKVPAEEVTVELGMPLVEPLAAEIPIGEMTIIPSQLPGGDIGVYSHFGGYDTLSQSYDLLAAQINGSGLQAHAPIWEMYVTQPTPGCDPATVRTDLFMCTGPAS